MKPREEKPAPPGLTPEERDHLVSYREQEMDVKTSLLVFGALLGACALILTLSLILTP